MPPQVQPQLLPLLEVSAGGNGAADPLLGADGPVLLEGGGADDGGLVDAGAGEDLVRALLEREVALGRPRLVGQQLPVRVHDVVLDQRVARPPVHGQVAGPVGRVGAFVFDGSDGWGGKEMLVNVPRVT